MFTKSFLKIFFIFPLIIINSCKNSEEVNMADPVNIIFLHHSTGKCIWEGGLSNFGKKLGFDSDVVNWFDDYNDETGKNYKIQETDFPKKSPYGWNNYPFDYYNIWVKNAGTQPFMEEQTLELLTKKYDVIIFKHCYPVSSIQADSTTPDINSDKKTLGNYKLQYEALKSKLLEFPETKFIVWTPTALVEKASNKDEAVRATEFSEWVKSIWDTKGDNIYLWDFRDLQVDGGLFFKNEYAESELNSHPNAKFSKSVAPYFCNRIVDVIENRGDNTKLTGKLN